ncbi:MAG: outer membrane lipid asymmetry maintenance protein MlaD [Burkholderiales bacterium]|nr:outer membrane lipid asymmetry maintenance protein MlaD [Sulfuricellaceae bacterium]
MERATIDLWVGIFVAAGIAALFVLALKVGNMGNFSAADTYKLEAHFENVGGLKPRAPVKSSGVVVGRVADISFDTKRYDALVTFVIDKRYQFSRDATASILTAGLLGEQYVGLTTGGDDVMLKNGDVIKLTQSAVVLENLIGQFMYNKASESGATGSGK